MTVRVPMVREEEQGWQTICGGCGAPLGEPWATREEAFSALATGQFFPHFFRHDCDSYQQGVRDARAAAARAAEVEP